MKQWLADYLKSQKAAQDSIPLDAVAQVIEKLRLALNDNVSWMTALANDYSYEDAFVGQLQNYGRPGDLALGISVSGNSPNCVKALEWARKNGLQTVALVGAKRGRMAEIAEQSITINDTHYGRVEDAQMAICHMLCYAFIENPEWGR